MRILVTGGAGFIGSHYVRTLLSGGYPDGAGTDSRPGAGIGSTGGRGRAGADVVVLDKLTYAGRLANLEPVAGHQRLTFVRGDIRDRPLVDDVMTGVDLVVHFAAETHVDRSITDAAAFVQTNVAGTQTLLDAAVQAKVGRFVQVSTDEVYGSIEHGSWTESQPLAPNSPYSASKAGADLLALAYARTHDLDVVVTRCSNNYGPYQYPEKVIPLFVTNLLQGRSVPLYGDGENVRDWLHVDDHCRGVQLVADHGRAGEIYHLGGGIELTNRQLTARLLAACGADASRVQPVADRQGHDRRYSLDISKIRTELGYQPRIPFEQGLAETVRWYREHETWWRPLRDTTRPA